MSVEFDFSEVLKLAADIDQVPRNASQNIRKAVEVTARNVRDAWREQLAGSQTVPAGPASVTYDMKGGGGEIVGEIGPELGRTQGPLVGMLEYGTPTTGPRGFGAQALKQNEADFERGISIATGQAEREAGL